MNFKIFNMSMKDCCLRQVKPEFDSYAEEFELSSESDRGQLGDLKMGCHAIHFVFWKDHFGCSVKNWLVRRDLRDKNTLLEAIGSLLGKRC